MKRLANLLRANLAWFLGVGLMLVTRASFADHYFVPSGSMRPTVAVGDHVFVDKMAYGLRVPLTNYYLWQSDQPQRGDVVVLDSPVDDRVLLKRVVAGPGDSVVVRGGELLINGVNVPVSEVGDHLTEALGVKKHDVRLTNAGGRDFGPLQIPTDRFLVMGDNRGESYDGRYFGLIERGAILGRGEAVCLRDGHLTWRPL